MIGDRWHLGKRIAPPMFLLFGAVFVVLAAALVPMIGPGRGTMVAFDVAAVAFFVAAAPVIGRSASDIRHAAADNDANRSLLLILTALVTAMILVAVAHELGGRTGAATGALVLVTLTLAWLFSNVVYALHYAHLFYSDGDDGGVAGGLGFPATDRPAYADFLYFAVTLGMTFQTSDVEIASTAMRRVVTGHCLAAFVFNLGVLAFTINVLGS